MSAEIAALGMVSPLGLSAAMTAAAVQAEISRVRDSSILDRQLEPIKMALVAHPDLPPLAGALQDKPAVTSRRMRMLRLAGPALKECLADVPRVDTIPVLLAGPEAYPKNRLSPADLAFVDELRQQAEIEFDVPRSRVFALGRAGVFVALEQALDGLSSGRYHAVVVGGVDTYLDLYLLGTLDLEGRILRRGVFDGFIPAEGAAFLLLVREGRSQGLGKKALAKIEGAKTAEEPGHRYNPDEAYRGDGLDAAVRGVLAAAPGDPVATVYAGFNGENFNAKEWGVAYMRSRKHFADDFAIEHPADCLGDTGAALGPLLLGLSARALSKGLKKPRCLVWCSSDMATRGAAVLVKA